MGADSRLPWLIGVAGAAFALILAVGLIPSLRAAAGAGAQVQRLRTEEHAVQQVTRQYPQLRLRAEAATRRLEQKERELPDPTGLLRYPGNWEVVAGRAGVDLLRVAETSPPSPVTYAEGKTNHPLPYFSVDMVIEAGGPRDRLVAFAGQVGALPALIIRQLTLQAANQKGATGGSVPPDAAQIQASPWTLTIQATVYVRDDAHMRGTQKTPG